MVKLKKHFDSNTPNLPKEYLHLLLTLAFT